MNQNRPVLVTTEEIAKLPILIVDKKGFIGKSLTKILRDQFLVVVVTAADIEQHDNVIHIPYRRKIPLIPDNAYSHIFVFYNGEEEIVDMLFPFEQKAEAVNARILLITSLTTSNAKLFNKILRPEYRLLQTVLYGETFENAIAEANEVNFFIHQARTYGRIEVPGEGLGKLYPIFFDDILTALVSIAFTLEKPTKPIFLFPHHAYNEITIARIIQSADPTVKVDFTKKRKSSARKYYIPDGLYFFRSYKLDEALHKIDYSRLGHRSKLPQKRIKLKIPDSEAYRTRVRFIWATILAIFIAPLLVTILCAAVGAGFLALSAKQLEGGGLQSALQSANVAQNAFTIAQTLGPSLVLPQLLLPQQKEQFLELMYTGQTVSATEISFVQAVQTLKDIYEKKSLDPKNDFLESIVTIKNALLTLQQLEAENKLPSSVVSRLHKMDGAINLVEETIDTWPNVFGFMGKKTYLVLFQNNMELRPGGGFIGSYGIVHVNNGTFDKMQIHDVYDADGQLSEAIQPPYGLARYLGATHWFLRDSNFDPDFSVDAKQAAIFLQKETGEKADGVIAIDTNVIKNVIGLVGAVTVPDYNVTVTPDNFYVLTETNSEKNFFPGSTQKKDFLRSLTNALMNTLASKKISYDKFAQLFVQSVAQKDFLMAFSDTGIQNVFTVNDLSSSLWDGRAEEKNTADDFLGVVDANVGGNKANYYVSRSIIQSTSLSDLTALQTTVEITYKNMSQRNSVFGGDYKDYLRLIVPANTTLVSVAFDNKPVTTTPAITDPGVFTSSDFIPPQGLEVTQDQEAGKNSIGFFFIVPAGTTKAVSVSYRTPSGIDPTAAAFGYNLRIFKEPGTATDQYEASVAFPNQITLVGSDKAYTNVGGKIIYDGYLAADKDITASFAKK